MVFFNVVVSVGLLMFCRILLKIFCSNIGWEVSIKFFVVNDIIKIGIIDKNEKQVIVVLNWLFS